MRNQLIKSDLHRLLPRREGTAEAGISGGARSAVRSLKLGPPEALAYRISKANNLRAWSLAWVG